MPGKHRWRGKDMGKRMRSCREGRRQAVWPARNPVELSDHLDLGMTEGFSRVEPRGGIGAGDRVRTGDINLGKVALYQLSYSRLMPTLALSPLTIVRVNSCNRHA